MMNLVGKTLEFAADAWALHLVRRGKAYSESEMEYFRAGRMDDFAIALEYSRHWKVRRWARKLSG